MITCLLIRGMQRDWKHTGTHMDTHSTQRGEAKVTTEADTRMMWP